MSTGTFPSSITILGYGTLGRQTLHSIVKSAGGLLREYNTKITVFDPAGQSAKGFGTDRIYPGTTKSGGLRKWSTRDKGYSIEWKDEYEDNGTFADDVYVLCVPSHELRGMFRVSVGEPAAIGLDNVWIVRTTADLELLDNLKELRNLDKNPSMPQFPNMVYWPEYATDKELEALSKDHYFYWTSTQRAESVFRDLLVNEVQFMKPVASFQKLAAHKLMSNALLATLYSFNNEAALIYRKLEINNPLELHAADVAYDILSRPPRHLPLAYGGKCLGPALVTLDRFQSEHVMGGGTLWGALVDRNELRTEKTADQALAYVRAHAKKHKRKNTTCALLGLNSHADVETSYNEFSPAEDAKMRGSFQISYLNPPELVKRVANLGYLPGPSFNSKELCAPYALFLMPMSKRRKIAGLLISNNLAERINYLTVLDPLCQFTEADIQALQVEAKRLSANSKKTFVLEFVQHLKG